MKKSSKNNKSTAVTELAKIHELIRVKIPRDIDYKKEIDALRLERLINKLNCTNYPPKTFFNNSEVLAIGSLRISNSSSATLTNKPSMARSVAN